MRDREGEDEGGPDEDQHAEARLLVGTGRRLRTPLPSNGAGRARPLERSGYFLPNWLSMPPASISIGGRSFVSSR